MKNTELKWIKNTTAAFLVTATLFPSVLVIAQLSSVPVTNMLVCLGFAIALTAWFGKSPYQVNAPTISVGLVCMDCASRYGLQGLSIAVALGGLMQLLIGTFKLGRYFRAIPDATLKGLMAGIGIEIIIRQVPVLYAPIEKLWQGSTDGLSVAFGAGALVLAFGWNALLPGKVVKVLPGILLVVLVVAGLSVMFGQADQSILFGAYSNPLLSKGLIWNNEFLFYGFSIALISSLKSLITAVKMDDNNMTDMDYELKVSGVVNAICGLLAGLPVSGHIARSMLLKEVASDSKPSLLMQIVWFAAFSFASFKFAIHLPEVTLAAILIFCSVKLIDVKFFKEHIKYGKTDLILAFTTLLCVVIFNINFGLFAGFILGLFRVTATLSADLKIDVAKTEDGKKAQVKLSGAVTFLNLPALFELRKKVNGVEEVFMDTSRIYYFDRACISFFTDWQKQASSTIKIDYISLLERADYPDREAQSIISELKSLDRRKGSRGPGRRAIDRYLGEVEDSRNDKESRNNKVS